MRVTITLDLNDDDLTEAYGRSPADGLTEEWGDVVAAFDARLGNQGQIEAVYMGTGDMPVRGSLVSVVREAVDA